MTARGLMTPGGDRRLQALRAAQVNTSESWSGRFGAGVEGRLRLARRVIERFGQDEPVLAAMVVGSTAFGRCSASSDLDIVAILPRAAPGPAVISAIVEGVQVDIERLPVAEALAKTEGDGWVWELRDAARLGCGIAVFDPQGFADQLRARSRAMNPWPDLFEEQLRGVYLSLLALSEMHGELAHRSEVLRGCFDNLALLTLLQQPRRYRKAKWTLCDLLHAGQDDLALALLDAYAIDADEAGEASVVLLGAQAIIERVHALTGAPSHEALMAMGYAPDHAQASYVSRCLGDAYDLAADEAYLEAQYTAKFAVRLSAGVLAGNSGRSTGVLDAFAMAESDLEQRYLGLFDDHEREGPEDATLRCALAAADACKQAMGEPNPAEARA